MKSGMIISVIVGVIIVLVIIGFVIFGNNSYSMPQPSTNTAGSAAGASVGAGSNVVSGVNTGVANAQTTNVQIANFAFSPSTLTIKVGDSVVWTNSDSVSHTVTSDSGNELNSGTLNKGATYAHTFTKAGTYNYHCSIHTMMTAQIVVQ